MRRACVALTSMGLAYEHKIDYGSRRRWEKAGFPVGAGLFIYGFPKRTTNTFGNSGGYQRPWEPWDQPHH